MGAIVLSGCEKEACEENNESSVVFWNKTGSSVIEYLTCGPTGNTGPVLPINAKSWRTGSPGETKSYCFSTKDGVKEIEVTFPSQCGETTVDIE